MSTNLIKHKFPHPLTVATDVLDDDKPYLGIVHEGVAIHDFTVTSCGRFDADPEIDYGMLPEDMKALADLEKVIECAVENALDAGCLTIQKHLGVTDGGFAGVFFSGPEYRQQLLKMFIDYAASEVNANSGE
jgi:hypothetical protein